MIRQATLEDCSHVYKLTQQLETYPLEEHHFKSTFQQIVQNNDWKIYLYDDQNVIKGVITVFKKNFLHHNHSTVEIVELIVDEKYRNHHIGKALIQHVESILKNENIEEIELSTSLWRKDAHRFYKRMGFDNNHYTFVKSLKDE